MTDLRKPEAGAPMPVMTIAKLGGGEITTGGTGGWQALIVYRGKHCPLCRKYLAGLNGLLEEFQALGCSVAVVSADTREKAETEQSEEGWRFPVGHDLSPAQMRELGVYISNPRAPTETDRPFSEPGLFITNPQGMLQVVDISNAPSARPDLHIVLHGLTFTQKNNGPVRGTA